MVSLFRVVVEKKISDKISVLINMMVLFTAAPVWVARPQDSHLEEGKPGYLHCYAQANPEPEVTWYRNNMMITTEVSYHTLAAYSF